MENNKVIQELIEEFDFSELSKKQKEQVLDELTEKEYHDLRAVIKMTVDYFENEPKLLADDSLKPAPKNENAFLRIINYNVPIYKVAVAVILVFSINLLISKKGDDDRIEIVENINEVESFDSLSIINEMVKYTSNNAIKYNTGLSRVY